jgi:undecaprenyl-diphosphatase
MRFLTIDLTLLKKINLGRNTSLGSFFIFITDSAAWIAFGVPALVIIWSIIKKNTIWRAASTYIFISVITSAVVSTIVKKLVARERPFITYSFIQKMSDGGSFSFPSGHTCDAFSFAKALCLTIPKWFTILPAFVWAFSVGYSRIALGVHYPSDVFGGIVIGGITAYVFHIIKQKWNPKYFPD